MSLLIKAKSWDEPVGKHFSLKEFRCPCDYEDCTETKVDLSLVGLLEEIRALLQGLMGHAFGVKITSGYRCIKHNSEILGAVPGSQHPMGKAADILVPNKYHKQVSNLVGARGGVGFYEDRLHVDVRGHMARWGKQIKEQDNG